MTNAKAPTFVIPTIKYGAALILMISGVFLSTNLISSHIISESSFCFLILSSILVGVLVCLSDRLKEIVFGFKEWRVVLSEIKYAQREIEDREKRIKEIAIVSADVVAHMAAFGGQMGSEESHKLDREWLASRFKRLATISESEVGGAAWRYMQEIECLDKNNSEQKELGLKAWHKAYEDIKKEIKT